MDENNFGYLILARFCQNRKNVCRFVDNCVLESEVIITAESPIFVFFEIHPNLQLALEDKNRKCRSSALTHNYNYDIF